MYFDILNLHRHKIFVSTKLMYYLDIMLFCSEITQLKNGLSKHEGAHNCIVAKVLDNIISAVTSRENANRIIVV